MQTVDDETIQLRKPAAFFRLDRNDRIIHRQHSMCLFLLKGYKWTLVKASLFKF